MSIFTPFREGLSEKAMATYSSTLAWKIPWREEPGRLQSMGSLSWTRLSDFTFTFHFHALKKKMATHSSLLAWRIPGMGEPGGLLSMGLCRVGHDWSHSAAAATAAAEKRCGLYLLLLTQCQIHRQYPKIFAHWLLCQLPFCWGYQTELSTLGS